MSLLTPEGNSHKFHRHLRKNDNLPVPHRWFQVLSLHLAGKSPKEIMELTGYSSAMYYRILNHPEVLSVRQQLLDETQKEFEALFPKVVDNIREQLHSEDPQIQLAAQTQFFKATGKFSSDKKSNEEKVTAEELVARLLQQQINIQVNVGGSHEEAIRIEDSRATG